ncbi:MAG TPA: methyltransferase, partial [Ruegeria sp.]|nr:methyltransferase [Ruegeria sp.]
VSAFAARLPGLQWQPTEVDAQRRASIDAYCEALDTVAPAQELNATRPGWGADWAGQDLVVLINLLHLISEGEAATLISEAAAALAPGGRLVIYGPFMRAGELTSEGDERFHAALTAQDPEIGYKDDFDIIDRMQEAGLELAEVVEMPANNLALIAEKPRI